MKLNDQQCQVTHSLGLAVKRSTRISVI